MVTLDVGERDGRLFGLLTLGNAIDNGGQARANGKGPPPRTDKHGVGLQLRCTVSARALDQLAKPSGLPYSRLISLGLRRDSANFCTQSYTLAEESQRYGGANVGVMGTRHEWERRG